MDCCSDKCSRTNPFACRHLIKSGWLYSVLFFFVFCHQGFAQVLSEEWQKSEYLILLSGYISWEDEDQIDTFEIGVLASEPVYTELSFKAESRSIKTKPFQVTFFKRIRDIRPVNILYVGEEINVSLRRVWNRVIDQPVLIVTDSSNLYEYTMINLLSMNFGSDPFEINKANIEAAGLAVSAKILAFGGTEEDLREIYRASEEELAQRKSEIDELNEELQHKQTLLDSSMRALQQRMLEIDQLNGEIRLQTIQLDSLSDNVELKQQDLAGKIRLLDEQEGKIGAREAEISTLNEEIAGKEKEIQNRSDTIKEQQRDIRQQKALMDEQQAILDDQSLQIEWQKHVLIFFIILSMLVLVLGFFVYRAYRVKKRTNRILREKNHIIREQNENITASIYYALTIQQAMLPVEDEMNNLFSTFIIFYPKDIVSGDFYWFSHLGKKKSGEDTSFVAVVDCTGHGVPGGFLSMIGARMLSEIINENKVYQTDRILELMDQRLRQALHQHKSENDDGMEVCLCKIVRLPPENEKRPEIYISYTGARLPLFLVRNNQPVETVKADRRTIGGKHFNPSPFTKKELSLEEGDRIFLATDGLMDQNAPSRERFGSPRFIQFINDQGNISMWELKVRLEELMLGFMKTEKQRDDITIMGIKL